MAETIDREPDEEIGFAILELLGHRRLGGFVRIEQKAGVGFFRIDVPAANGHPAFTQWYAPSALYCLSPVTEEVARAVARSAPEPATRWEVKAIEATANRPVFGEPVYRAGDDSDDDTNF